MLGQTCQQEAHHGQYDLHLCMPLQLGVKGWESKVGRKSTKKNSACIQSRTKHVKPHTLVKIDLQHMQALQ
jgi:hypothetical protein